MVLILKKFDFDQERKKKTSGKTDEMSTTMQKLMMKGCKSFKQKRYLNAIKCFNKVLKINPNSKVAWNNKGHALQNLGSFAEAVGCYDRAIKIDPNFRETWNNKGVALRRLGSILHAINCFDKAIEINAERGEVWNNKGSALFSIGHIQRSINCFEKAASFSPENEVVWNNLGKALVAVNQNKKALKHFNKAIKINPDYEVAWKNKGDSLAALGRGKEAIKCYDKAIKINPNYEDAWDKKGDLLHKSDRIEDARKCYKNAARSMRRHKIKRIAPKAKKNVVYGIINVFIIVIILLSVFSFEPGSSKINIDGNFDDWQDVTPHYDLRNDVNSSGSGARITHNYLIGGSYSVTLTVRDNRGDENSTTRLVAVATPPANKLPRASFSFLIVNSTVTFDASASGDPDGNIVSYYWAFGDRSNGGGMKIDHVYSTSGTYTVILIVRDNRGGTATTTHFVSIISLPESNKPPVASFSFSVVNSSAAFDASTSSDPDGYIESYSWTFGDGVEDEGIKTAHTYLNVGTYTVTLNVTDDDGEVTSTYHLITVIAPSIPNELPLASFNLSTADLTVDLNGSNSSDPDGSIISHVWDFGDGLSGEGIEVSHTYLFAGTYTLTLTVTDNDGGTASTSKSITISWPSTPNEPPVANFSFSVNSLTVTFDAFTSTDSNGTIVSYSWDFDDNNPDIDILTYKVFRDNAFISFYAKVDGNMMAGQYGYDTFRIFIDSDDNILTGYNISGVGADYMMEVQGKDGFIISSTLYIFDEEQKTNSWARLYNIPALSKNQEFETQILPIDILVTDDQNIKIIFYMSDVEGHDDSSDMIINAAS